MSQGWIGVDLDGTLARYDGWEGDEVIGEPIYAMVQRVKKWIAEGREVRIVTARAHNGPHAVGIIRDWCHEHIGVVLAVTATKDFGMIELWDDRAVSVVPNTGEIRFATDHLKVCPQLSTMTCPDCIAAEA